MSVNRSRDEWRARLDDSYRDHLDDTYGSDEFQRDATGDTYLDSQGVTPDKPLYGAIKPLMRQSFERVRREVVHGRERYWYTQGRGASSSYQMPSAVADVLLAKNANSYMATATGLVRLAGEHLTELRSRGVAVDDAALEALQEMVDAIA
jgi:hypothetical protein